jgi:nickel/cobalt exporter
LSASAQARSGQLKRFVLGFALVLAFSLGLALTLVTVGALAALSVKHATRRFAGLHKLAAKMPYASAALMTLIGLLVCIQGVRHLLH